MILTPSPNLLRVARRLLYTVTLLVVPAQAQTTLYRCPGPPVIYADNISVEDAKARKCLPIQSESRWAEVGSGNDTTVYVDTQSVRRNGSKVRIWLKWLYTSAPETSGYPKKKYLAEKALDIYNCTERSSATLQIIRYANADASGEVVESLSIPESKIEYRDLAPETIGERILNYVCRPSAAGNK